MQNPPQSPLKLPPLDAPAKAAGIGCLIVVLIPFALAFLILFWFLLPAN
jgi:p-aminobenzoyl-glutamate transporter AbgT